MKRILLLLLLAVTLTSAAHAQTSATLWLSSQRNGDGGSFPIEGRNLTTTFDNGSGFGASIDHRIGSFSGELAVFRLTSEGNIAENGTNVFSLGDLELTPVTAMVRWHFGHFYAGAGAAFVTASDLDSDDIRDEGIGPVEIDRQTSAVIGAGLTYDFGQRLGVALDARYLPLSIGGRPSAGDDRIEAELDPLIISAGLRIRF